MIEHRRLSLYYMVRAQAAFRSVPALVLIAMSHALAQSVDILPGDILSGTTPPEVAPGTPAGSHPLSGFESINPYSGRLNFALPLLAVGGRGEAGYTMTLNVDTSWKMEKDRFCESNGLCTTAQAPAALSWAPVRPGYGPGVLVGRLARLEGSCTNLGGGTVIDDVATLARLTLIAPDGTETELRDELSDGEPWYNPGACVPRDTPQSRGTVFKSFDGSAITFISDTVLSDSDSVSSPLSWPTGYLMFPDGVRYRIVEALVRWIRDRNGNVVQLEYNDFQQVQRITDSVGRAITITYHLNDCPASNGHAANGSCDDISFTGATGNSRLIRIRRGGIQNQLETGNVPMSKQQLWENEWEFPPETVAVPHNPVMPFSVELPDGRTYELRYNSYGELASVVLPTGGKAKYTWEGGLNGGANSILQRVGGGNLILRHTQKREVYPDGVTLEGSERLTHIETSADTTTTVTIERRGADQALLAKEVHYYYGSAIYNEDYTDPTRYARWRAGKEYKTEHYDTNGTTVLRSSAQAWVQRPATNPWWSNMNETAQPPNDPRVTSVVTTLEDGQTGSKVEYDYDDYNNRTNVREYGYGTPFGSLIRETITSFVSQQGAVNYATDPNIHLRRLPKSTIVNDDSGRTVRSATWAYDAGTPQSYSDISGHCATTTLSSGTCALTASRGNRTSEARAASSTTTVTRSWTYDIAGNVKTATDGKLSVNQYSYTDNFSTSTNLSGAMSYAFPTTITLPPAKAGATAASVSRAYDYWIGRPTSATDQNSVQTQYAYADPLDRLTQVDAAAGTANDTRTVFVYPNATNNNTLTTIRCLAPSNSQCVSPSLVREAVLDGLGRTTTGRQHEDSGSIGVDTLYDGMGRVWKVSNPYRTSATDWTATVYDALGRVKTVTAPGGAVTTNTYSLNSVTATDPGGISRTVTTDAVGRIAHVVENPSGSAVHTYYDYDTLGNLTLVCHGAAISNHACSTEVVQQRSFTYDWLGRLLSATNPEAENQATTYTSYDGNGNLLSKTDAAGVTGVTVAYGYDNWNRITSKTYTHSSTPAVTYCYDGDTTGGCAGAPSGAGKNLIGRLTRVTSTSATMDYNAYDELGRVLASAQKVDSASYPFTYQYDVVGLVRESYPSGRVVAVSHDAAGRIATLWNGEVNSPNKYASSITYAPHGGLSGMTLGNGKYEETCYNNRLQASGIRVGTATTSGTCQNPGDDVVNLGFEYGAASANNGNVRSQTITAGGTTFSQSYQYEDGFNRLTSASEGANWSRSFSYDALGNMWVSAATGIPASTFTPTTEDWYRDAQGKKNNRLINAALGVSYDTPGNLKTIGVYSFTYDGENRLLTSTNGGTTTYVYDGEGRRVKKVQSGSTTVYVYDAGGQLVAEYATATGAESGTQYATVDHLGSTRLVTADTGQVLKRYDYLPFGEEIPAGIGGRTTAMGYQPDSFNPKFTGKERDGETGLDYFGARYFSAAQGRFTSPDWSDKPAPVPYADLKDPQTLNLYAYVRNNPLRLSDPDGHGFWSKLGNWLTGGGWNEDDEAARVRAEAAARFFRAEVQAAREYFAHNPTMINGQIVDPDKTGDRAIVDAYYQAAPVLGNPFDLRFGSIPIEPGQLQAKFKHAEDFGVKGNWGKAAAQEFEQAVQNHVNDPATQVIKGTYRGQSVVHHLNPQTGLNVMTDSAGKFISGWKLNPQQLQNVLTRGSL